MVSAYAFQSVFPISNGLIDVHVIYTVVVAVVVVCFSYHPHDSDMCVFTYIRVNSRARVPANDMWKRCEYDDFRLSIWGICV